MSGPLRRLRYNLSTRPWSLKYIFEKATQQTIPFGLTEAFGEDGTKDEDVPAMELMRRINAEVLDKPLCSTMLFRGEAMTPALSCAPRFKQPSTTEDTKTNTALNVLVVRPLRHSETMPLVFSERVGGRWFFPRPARVGDVVAFIHPDMVAKAEDQQVVLVRRVTALAGDVLVSGDDDDTETSETYEIEDKRAWVVADNPDVDLTVAPDSRVFGPIEIESIVDF